MANTFQVYYKDAGNVQRSVPVLLTGMYIKLGGCYSRDYDGTDQQQLQFASMSELIDQIVRGVAMYRGFPIKLSAADQVAFNSPVSAKI